MADGDIKQRVPYPKGPAYTFAGTRQNLSPDLALVFGFAFVTSLLDMPSMETVSRFLMVRLCTLHPCLAACHDAGEMV